MNTNTLHFSVTHDEIVCEVLYDPKNDNVFIFGVTDLQGNSIPWPDENDREEIIRKARAELPNELYRAREVRHFRYQSGRFSIGIMDEEIRLNSLAGKCPPLPIFLSALQQMIWFPILGKAQLESRQFAYTVQVTGEIGKSFRLREARDASIHDYPVRAHLRISGRNRVQDFRMMVGYLVPILHCISKKYWYPHQEEGEVTEVPVFEPDSEFAWLGAETIKALPEGGFELIKATSEQNNQ